MLRLFRDYMAHKDLWLAPVETFKEHALFGYILVVNEEQFNTVIKIPTLCIQEDADLVDVLRDLKRQHKILEFYLYSGSGKDIFNHCNVVDDTFFKFKDKWYFIPFMVYDKEKNLLDITNDDRSYQGSKIF